MEFQDIKGNPSQLHAFVARGPDKGTVLYPHICPNGEYVVATTKYRKDQQSVADAANLLPLVEQGLKLRMSNPAAGVTGPRLIEPGAIYRLVNLNV